MLFCPQVTLYHGDQFGLRGTDSKEWFYFFSAAADEAIAPVQRSGDELHQHTQRAQPSQRPQRGQVNQPRSAAKEAMENGTWSSGLKPGEAESRGYSFFANPKGQYDSPRDTLQLRGDTYFFNTIHLRQPGDVGQSTGEV